MKSFLKKRKLFSFISIIGIIFLLPILVIGRVILQQSNLTNTLIGTGASTSYASQKRTLEPGNDWPTYLYNNERTANNPETVLSTKNVDQLTKVWSFKTGGTIASAAAVVNGVVYFGSWDGYEYALDELTGALKWKTFLGITHAKPVCNPPTLGVSSGATVENGIVYVGGGDAYWYALNANTGKVLWKVFTGDNSADGGHYNWSSPLIYHGSAYIGVASLGDCPLIPGKLLKVDLETHEITAEFDASPPHQVGGGIWTSPSVDPTTNTVFLATGTETIISQPYSQAVVALDANTLQVKSAWKLPASEDIGDSDFDTTPILFNDASNHPLVAAVNKDGNIFVYNRNNVSQKIWQKSFNIAGNCPICEFSSVSSAAFGQGTLYVGAGNTDIGSTVYRGSVTAMDPSNGTFLWRHGSVDGAIIGALAYSNGLVIAGMGTELSVLDASTGALLYSYDLNSFMFSAPVISHGMIYEGTVDGTFYAFGLNQTPSTLTHTSTHCQSGWTCQDVGTPIFAGTQNITGNSVQINAGGGGISNSSDQFHIAGKKISGDQQLTAKLTSQQIVGAGGETQIGLMARQNTDPTSPYYAVLLTPQKGLTIQYRNIFGGITTSNTQIPQASFPIYLNVQRQGDQFQAAYSTNGKTFNLIPGSTANVVMPASIDLGMVASAYNQETIVTANFDDVTYGSSTTTLIPPSTASSACPTSWTCGDIGNPAISGSQTIGNEQNWTITGGGTNIWYASDQFHYASKPLGNAKSASVRIANFNGSTPNSQVGLMLRENRSTSSAYYAIFLEPNANHTETLSVEIRDAQGVLSGQIATIKNVKAPIYIQITTTPTTISGYTSSDGNNWTLINNSTLTINTQNFIPGAQIDMTMSSAVVGFAVSSHSSSANTSATFDEFTLH